MVTQVLIGGSYLLRGLALLVRPGIRRYVVIPLALNVTLFGLGIWYVYGWLQAVFAWIDSFLPSWLHWLYWLVTPVLVVAVAGTLFFTFSMLTNLIAAPFNSLLAEQVEYQLTGRFPDGEALSGQALLSKTIPLLWDEIGKIGHAVLWMIPFLLLFIIPFVHVAAPFCWLLYSSWMLAIQYLDLPMGNHDMTGRQVRRLLRSERPLSLGFGGMVLLLNTLPVVNFIAMPAAVAGATLLWVERFAPERQKMAQPTSTVVIR
ncbi:MAG: sulfate transporter CysZ [Magnetococcales bacterium]|nr:sulfate transporter CysZ [Magnetococcales bacterium]